MTCSSQCLQCCRPQGFRNISLDTSYNPKTQAVSFLPKCRKSGATKINISRFPALKIPGGCLWGLFHPPYNHQSFWALFLKSWCWYNGILTLWQFSSAITGSALVGYVLGMTNLSPGSPIISSTSRGKLPLKNKAAAAKNQTRQLDQG